MTVIGKVSNLTIEAVLGLLVEPLLRRSISSSTTSTTQSLVRFPRQRKHSQVVTKRRVLIWLTAQAIPLITTLRLDTTWKDLLFLGSNRKNVSLMLVSNYCSRSSGTTNINDTISRVPEM